MSFSEAEWKNFFCSCWTFSWRWPFSGTPGLFLDFRSACWIAPLAQLLSVIGTNGAKSLLFCLNCLKTGQHGLSSACDCEIPAEFSLASLLFPINDNQIELEENHSVPLCECLCLYKEAFSCDFELGILPLWYLTEYIFVKYYNLAYDNFILGKYWLSKGGFSIPFFFLLHINAYVL